MLTVVNQGLLSLAKALTGTMPAWVQMHLYQNPVEPTPATVIGDLTEATFSTYAPATLTWSPPFINGDGKGQTNAASTTWVSGPPDSQVIYGAYWTDNNADLVAVDPFETPVSLAAGGVSIPYQPTFTSADDT